tara:strand:- start:2751 stop:3023 length:273 start_codon:yes stop_codon:yes gene_type:complete
MTQFIDFLIEFTGTQNVGLITLIFFLLSLFGIWVMNHVLKYVWTLEKGLIRRILEFFGMAIFLILITVALSSGGYTILAGGFFEAMRIFL